MKNTIRILSCAILLAVFNPLWADDAEESADKIVAKVNGTSISMKEYQDYITARQNQARRSGQDTEVKFETAIDEMIIQELVIADALKNKLDETPEFTTRMEALKRALLMEVAARDYIDNNQPSEEALRAEYEKTLKELSSTEYNASHILVETREAAEEIIKKLKNGDDFSEIAKEKSTDTGTAITGGDLGWFPKQRMVKSFGDAVATLEKGQFTESPIETGFGWHIIFLKDTRQAEQKKFEEVKDYLRAKLQQEQGAEYTAALKTQAKIEILYTPPEVEEKSAKDDASSK